MKIKIQKTLIENALTKSIPFLNTKDSSNVTSNVQIVAIDGLVTVSATDYDMGLLTTLKEVEILTDGNAIANGQKLLGIIKILKNDFITIESKKDILHITQGKSKFKTPILSEQFPTFPDDKLQVNINIDSNLMIESLRKITPTVDINNPKFELNGALIDIKRDCVDFASTDIKRLSYVSIPNESENELSMIVPKRAVIEIQKLFDDNIEMYCSDVHMIIKSDRFSFFTKLVAGKFPDYKRVIPKEYTHSLTINKFVMIENIKQIAAISSEIKMSFSDDGIVLESHTNDNNEARTEFDLLNDIPNDMVICMNSKFILDFLNTIYSDTFELNIVEANMPFVLESDDLKTVVMPIVI